MTEYEYWVLLPSRILLTITNKKRQKTPNTGYRLKILKDIYIDSIRTPLFWYKKHKTFSSFIFTIRYMLIKYIQCI